MAQPSSAADPTTVRLAFECLQMIITDFQHTVPSRCFPLLLSSLGLFGRQTAAVNVALTAVESLWNVADYLQQNKVRASLVWLGIETDLVSECCPFPVDTKAGCAPH